LTLSPELLVVVTLVYLGMLLLAAHVGDSFQWATRLSRKPMVIALALGVYATSWSYFGSVGMAAREGYRFITIYVGVTLACTAAPAVWTPLARVLRERQLSTLPDLFAFRYRSQALGVLCTLFMLAGSLPYQALQLRALVGAVQLLSGTGAPELIGLITCGGLALFGALYGARHLAPRERHDGFVLAVAMECVVKLVALLAVGGFAVFGVLWPAGGIEAHLEADMEASLSHSVLGGPWSTLLLLAFSAAFLLPRQWHVAFTEGGGSRSFRTIAWVLPLYLLLLTVMVPPILWSGQIVAPGSDPDFHVLHLARVSGSRGLAALVFLGGLSASTAMILMTAVPLASMCLTHLVLPVTGQLAPRGGDLYRRLRWLRRALIAVIVTAGYLFYRVLRGDLGLADLGLVSFVAIAQFLPGLFGVLLWPRATARGTLWGLVVGAVGWSLSLAVPLLVSVGVLPESADILGSMHPENDPWTLSTALSLGGNAFAFVLMSLWSPPSPSEAEAAAVCRREVLVPEGFVSATSPSEFIERLVPAIGRTAATIEVERARSDLRLAANERRPAELRRLRDRVEQNLSGLLGPVLSRALVDQDLSLDPGLPSAVATRLYLHLSDERARRPPAASELEAARRYLRRIVQDLPQGVCTVDPSSEVVLWNAALAAMTGIASDQAVGAKLAALAEPWGPLLDTLCQSPEPRREACLTVQGVTRDLALVKSAIDPTALPGTQSSGGFVLLVEDLTEQHALSALVAHQDRLASIGRLAAGVAHEIGNPLTGIASVAQNLRSELDAPDVSERLDLIVEQTRRIDRIVRALVSFAHAGIEGRGASPRERVSVSEIVREAFTLTRLSKEARHVSLTQHVSESLVALGDHQRLVQVLVNLLANACDASPIGGYIEVYARAEAQKIVIEVVDHGTGMSPSVRARALEPFFTTKSAGEGTGLGLSLVYSMVMELSGSLTLDSELSVGTKVTVRLQAADAPEAMESAP